MYFIYSLVEMLWAVVSHHSLYGEVQGTDVLIISSDCIFFPCSDTWNSVQHQFHLIFLFNILNFLYSFSWPVVLYLAKSSKGWRSGFGLICILFTVPCLPQIFFHHHLQMHELWWSPMSVRLRTYVQNCDTHLP